MQLKYRGRDPRDIARRIRGLKDVVLGNVVLVDRPPLARLSPPATSVWHHLYREIEGLSHHLATVNTLNREKIKEGIYGTTDIGPRNARIDVMTHKMLVPTSPFIRMKRDVDAAIERWIRWEGK